MKKFTICFIFLFISLFTFCIDVKADDEDLNIQTCQYNVTGYNLNDGSSSSENNWYVEFRFYYDDQGNLAKSDFNDPGRTGTGYGVGVAGGAITDEDQAFSYISGIFNSDKCFEYLMRVTNGYNNSYYMFSNNYNDFLTRDSIFNLAKKMGVTSKDNLTELRFLKLIGSENPTKGDVCEYDNFSIQYSDKNTIISINSNGNNIRPSAYINVQPTDVCRKVYVCSGNGADYNMLFYDDEDAHMLGYGYNNCIEYDTSSKKAIDYYETSCRAYTAYVDGVESRNYLGLDDYWNITKEEPCKSDASCISENMTKYKNRKEVVRTWCNSVLSSQNASSSCSVACLNLASHINQLEGTSSVLTTCGFSDRLINWIKNIMRWIKYLLPVVVIVFGIIDFIKAIASEKDDELKKAQGKFVKRLIIAAIAFLVPFIIEFVLDKMGFISESCGLW